MYEVNDGPIARLLQKEFYIAGPIISLLPSPEESITATVCPMPSSNTMRVIQRLNNQMGNLLQK